MKGGMGLETCLGGIGIRETVRVRVEGLRSRKGGKGKVDKPVVERVGEKGRGRKANRGR